MKKTLRYVFVFILLLTGINQSWSQQIRFTDSTNLWRASKSIAPDGTPYTVWKDYRAEDTFIEKNGHQYTVISYDDQNPSVAMYVREDTTTRKTYVIPVNWNPLRLNVNDTNEFVYMDFSMEVGDTLVMPVTLQDDPDDSVSVHVVGSIDSQQIGNQWYKQMYIKVISGMTPSWTSGENWYEVTEGIGPYSGPIIEPHSNGNEYGPYVLSCFSNNGVIPSPFGEHCFYIVSIDEVNKKETLFTIFPNPAQRQVTVSLLNDVKGGTVEIVDMTGRAIITQEIKTDQTTINTGNIQAGLYLVRVVNQEHIVSVKKLVVE